MEHDREPHRAREAAAQLRRASATRAHGARADVGQLVNLDPPSFTLVTPSGRRAVRLPAHLRDEARAHWGEDVVVDVEASVTIEGDVREPKATALRAVPRADRAAFERTLGAAKDIWASDEARAYVDELRGGRERH